MGQKVTGSSSYLERLDELDIQAFNEKTLDGLAQKEVELFRSQMRSSVLEPLRKRLYRYTNTYPVAIAAGTMLLALVPGLAFAYRAYAEMEPYPGAETALGMLICSVLALLGARVVLQKLWSDDAGEAVRRSFVADLRQLCRDKVVHEVGRRRSLAASDARTEDAARAPAGVVRFVLLTRLYRSLTRGMEGEAVVLRRKLADAKDARRGINFLTMVLLTLLLGMSCVVVPLVSAYDVREPGFVAIAVALPVITACAGGFLIIHGWLSWRFGIKSDRAFEEVRGVLYQALGSASASLLKEPVGDANYELYPGDKELGDYGKWLQQLYDNKRTIQFVSRNPRPGR
ncbi:hypothetical protein [Parvularcula maris]|uniref:Uncharacterized protein n=1 Tax=Parvularcula maris TaxID=2965077 RepID=A0A9X2L9P9_9PROT|nr:hypothetical protein [Parvularcula maris]MCQ8185689.1 hypothetical protein [Parvularcula maris]